MPAPAVQRLADNVDVVGLSVVVHQPSWVTLTAGRTDASPTAHDDQLSQQIALQRQG